MRTDLDHLPLGKRLELERIVEMLFQEFEDAVGRAIREYGITGALRTPGIDILDASTRELIVRRRCHKVA